jgi:hypothetical protein
MVEQRSALAKIMADDQYNGADLIGFTERLLPRVLKGSGAEAAAPLLLAARDEQLAAEEARAVAAATAIASAAEAAAAAAASSAAAAAVTAPEPAPAAATTERPSCSICMEPYSTAGGVVPRILVTCGHDYCEGCLDAMLWCATASRAIQNTVQHIM